MFKLCKTGLIAAGIACSATAAQAGAIQDALSGAKPLFNARLRYETVDQDARPEGAESVTFRVRAGFLTAPVQNTTLGLEFEWLEELV
ncbi:MAG: hypothetical protein AAF337_14450, partial [Pseudomonadota bacterium]